MATDALYLCKVKGFMDVHKKLLGGQYVSLVKGNKILARLHVMSFGHYILIYFEEPLTKSSIGFKNLKVVIRSSSLFPSKVNKSKVSSLFL